MQKSAYPAIGRNLIAWFETNGRDLPWRMEHRPYQIWISEIMLQQTRVNTMLPYYRRWMERFPDVRHVASASEEDLLKHWEGLGYYPRVWNIAETARILCAKHGGKLPCDHGVILNLPGIGPYTAGAVMSLAFNEDYPAVDGNVERILSRLLDIETPVKERGNRERIWKTARDLIPHGDARRFNQALMDLGAMVCLPAKPSCAQCPIGAFCLSFKRGVVGKRPVRSAKKQPLAIDVAVGILMRAGRFFIQKRPSSGLMPGLWEFPGGKVTEGETAAEALVRELREELGVEVCGLTKIAIIKHSYTSFRVTLHAFACTLRDETAQPEIRAAVEARWVSPKELEDFAFPAANRRLIRILAKDGGISPGV